MKKLSFLILLYSSFTFNSFGKSFCKLLAYEFWTVDNIKSRNTVLLNHFLKAVGLETLEKESYNTLTLNESIV